MVIDTQNKEKVQKKKKPNDSVGDVCIQIMADIFVNHMRPPILWVINRKLHSVVYTYIHHGINNWIMMKQMLNKTCFFH